MEKLEVVWDWISGHKWWVIGAVAVLLLLAVWFGGEVIPQRHPV